MNRVAVLGCGPAGLLAVHAASLMGADVRIFSAKSPSPIGGAQFLHQAIPGLTTEPDGDILFTKVGTREEYARKVYGNSEIGVSWDLWDDTARPAWSMKKAYNKLWEMYSDQIKDINIPMNDHRILRVIEDQPFDLLISSIPASFLCEHDQHIFVSVPMWIRQDSQMSIPMNTVIYNGDPQDIWNRASNLFGHKSVEYGRPLKWHENDNVITGYKPTSHTCDCNHQWMRVGRFGKWQRGILVHHAFNEVMRRIDALQ